MRRVQQKLNLWGFKWKFAWKLVAGVQPTPNFQKFLVNISNLDLKVWTNERISAPNGGYFNLFVLPYIFLQIVGKNVNEQLTIHWVGYVHFSVFFRTISWTNKHVLSF